MKPIFGPQDHVVRLRDGRLLGYAEFGDPGGFPVINCHGGLVCRLDVEVSDDIARDLGIRLISPDRPGIGLSDRKRGRSVADWSKDVSELADRLDLEQFAVLGWSMGGPYAAACAAKLDGRVSGLGLVAGAVPPNWPEAEALPPDMDTFFDRLVHLSKPVARLVFRGIAELVRKYPRVTVRLAHAVDSNINLELIYRDGIQTVIQPITEGLRGTLGVCDDYLAYDAPWGFEFEEIDLPVHLWQGEDDDMVPPNWSEAVADRIPHSTLHLLPGEGHLIARNHWSEIFETLVEDGTGPSKSAEGAKAS